MTPQPFISNPMPVREEWIDYNGHMNMAYYSVMFDEAADQIYPELGLGPEYARNQGFTTYSAEFHIRYIRELHLGDMARCSLHLIDLNDRSFHTYQELRHVDGWLAATAQTIGLHIDMSGPKVAPFPPDMAARFAKMKAEHAELPRPDMIGSVMAIRHKS